VDGCTQDVRKKMQGVLTGPEVPTVEDKGMLIEDVKNALYCSKICSYAQGMNLIKEASTQKEWGIDLGECARIWKGGCIIRAKFLDRIKSAYDRNSGLESLLLDPVRNPFLPALTPIQAAWRQQQHSNGGAEQSLTTRRCVLAMPRTGLLSRDLGPPARLAPHRGAQRADRPALPGLCRLARLLRHVPPRDAARCLAGPGAA
jgi:hypothetical protein